MSLWQYLAESYSKNSDALKASYPLSATSISNNTEWIAVIVIDGNGNFINARKIEKAKKDSKTKQDIIPLISLNIPVTEKSAGRTSAPCPHPVFDQYGYLKGSGKKFDGENEKGEHRKGYREILKDFAESEFAPTQIKAIHTYIEKRTVETDLKDLSPKDKTNIVFEVQTAGNPASKVWEDGVFFDKWHGYYLSTKNDVTVDSITGGNQLLAESHPKKISNVSANAKLVSDNDTSNFTFRGRFETSAQAVSIGYETSQKAHQFLRYLVNDRGVACGEQVILSFTIGSMENTLPPPLDDTKSILDFVEKNTGPQTETDKQIALRAATGSDYADALKKALTGSKYSKLMEQHGRTAVLALDAPISGRMSITFYRELARKEYLEKIAEWHEDCKWNQVFWREEDGKKVPVSFIGAPSVDRIIEAVLGRPRSFSDESYTKVKKTARECLLRCIFDGVHLPTDYLVSAIHRASNPLIVTRNGKFDRNGFGQILSTACALVRKDFKQRKMEDYALSLESERTDRNYLYGRLLGAADKLEEYALYMNEKDRIVTAAIRYMQTFSQRPFRTWKTIHDCLLPYIQKVKGGFAFQEIEAVKNLLRVVDFKNDAPLDGSYLIGYYHERAYIDKLVAEAKAKKQSTLETPSSINESENNHEPDEQN
jgi:CRISPR-associated protein Csd1